MFQKENLVKVIAKLNDVTANGEAAKSKDQLFDSEFKYHLVFTFNKISTDNTVTGINIHLPHSIVKDDASVCLIVKDSCKKAVKEALYAHPKLNVTKVMKLSKLKKNFVTFEARRNLCKNYDVFIGDRRIAAGLPHLLGKYFFNRHKFPMSISVPSNSDGLNSQKLAELVEYIKHTSYFKFPENSATFSIPVGVAGQKPEEIVENIQYVNELVSSSERFNGMSLDRVYLKTDSTPAVPVYVKEN